MALVKHSSARGRSHAFSAASPTVFHLCSTSAARAMESAMGRLLSAKARSKRCSGSVATSRAISLYPCPSRKRAILFFWSSGMDSRISAAVSMSPRRTSVWYSTTERERA